MRRSACCVSGSASRGGRVPDGDEMGKDDERGTAVGRTRQTVAASQGLRCDVGNLARGECAIRVQQTVNETEDYSRVNSARASGGCSRSHDAMYRRRRSMSWLRRAAPPDRTSWSD